jgi:hypothetical protein
VERFHRDEAAYAKWLAMNSNGFVVNEESSLLHAAECTYIGTGYKTKSTSTPKLCFPSRADLNAWASAGRIRLFPCPDCKVDTP